MNAIGLARLATPPTFVGDAVVDLGRHTIWVICPRRRLRVRRSLRRLVLRRLLRSVVVSGIAGIAGVARITGITRVAGITVTRVSAVAVTGITVAVACIAPGKRSCYPSLLHPYRKNQR